MSVNWGSVADWVSGFGSIAASGVALYLAGSDRRARRDADRPVVSCSLEGGGGDGWTVLRIGFDNPSSKQWQCVSAQILKPSSGKIVGEYEALDHEIFDGPSFSERLRDEHAREKLDLEIDIGPVGSHAPSYKGGGRGNYTYRRFYATKAEGQTIKIRLSFASLEPSPDRFAVDIVR